MEMEKPGSDIQWTVINVKFTSQISYYLYIVSQWGFKYNINWCDCQYK